MSVKAATTVALRALLTPIVRLLLKLGFSFKDFNEVAKVVFVEVASDEYGLGGRKTNMSRVAIMTGLTRREVARLRKVIDHDPTAIEDQTTAVGNLLTSWHQEPQFLDNRGRPLGLPLTGDNSFETLAELHRGDIPTTALLKELARVGAVEVIGNHAYARSRYYMPFKLDQQAIERFGHVIGDLANTIGANLVADSREQAHFEGRALNQEISPHAAEAFRRYLDRRGLEFLEEVDGWLTDHSADPEEPQTIRLGVGLYSIGSHCTWT